jgi:iron complex outermembrane receptor protein
LSASYIDAEIKDLPLRSGSPLDTIDVEPTYTPEFQAFAMARYGWDMLGGTMTVQGDISYSDEFYYNLRNFDADKFDSYTMVNALFSWESASEAPWTASLAVRNVTDERVGVQGFDLATLCGCNEVSYRAPRHMVLGFRKEF